MEKTKYILTLDSSTTRASVSISQFGKVCAFESMMRQKSHSEQMNVGIQNILNSCEISVSDLSAIAVTEGPGSFTGLRVAGNIAKTFSYMLNLPLIKINTLEVLAHQNQKKSEYVCVLVNAFKQMVFAAVYKQNNKIDLDINNNVYQSLTPIILPSLKSLEDVINVIPQEVNQIECIGDGFDFYSSEWSDVLRSKILRVEDSQDYPLAQTLAQLAFQKLKLDQTIVWKDFVPLYLKNSEAEENLRKGLLHVRKL